MSSNKNQLNLLKVFLRSKYKMKLVVPHYVKHHAKQALLARKRLPKSKQFGLDKKEANKLGIASGIERAKQLIRKSYFSWSNVSDRRDLVAMSKFYKRWRNCRSSKCEWNMKTWGTRKWLREEVIPFVDKMKRKYPEVKY